VLLRQPAVLAAIMPDSEDSIDHIPPIVPSRDEVASRQARKASQPRVERRANAGGGSGLWSRLFITVSLVVAAVACAWAWQLQQELNRSTAAQLDYESRIADLEDRLSDTDEGMNQSSAAMAVKIKELYSEVDKLWASAWRKNKAKIAALEKSSAAQGSQLATLDTTDKEYSAQLQKLGADLQALGSMATDLERTVQAARANESQMESLGDDVNRLALDLARLQKRVGANEEWVESINGFRKQVNRTLAQLQAQLGTLQTGATAAPVTPQ
jgi:DNA repair exonuclease SbcCD ATPase subunit